MATNAVTLNGSSQYGKLNNFTDIDNLTGDVTLEGWFKQNATGGNTYARAMLIANSTIQFAQITTENGTPSTGCNFKVDYTGTNADGYNTSGVFTTGTWMHVAMVGTAAGKTKVIVNGSEVSYNLQQTPTGSLVAATGQDFLIGVLGDLTTKHFKGDVACTRVWNYARTEAQIAANYQYYLDPAYEPGLIINLNFDEGSGTTIDNDASAGNDMSLTGSPSWTTGPTLTAKSYVEQEGFRFRDDDDDETAATWLAAQDTNVNRADDTTTRLRVLLNASGDPTAKDFQLEFKKSTDSVYEAVTDKYTNQGDIVDEDMSSTPGTGTTTGTATYVSGYMRMTEKVNSENGSFYYSGTLPSKFTVDYDMYADGSADANVFFFGTTSTSGNEETADGGYRIYFSEYHNLVAIRFNGTIIASQSYSNLGNATWRDVEIIKDGNSFTINIDASEVLAYTDSTRVLGGSYYGWGARTGGLNAEHRVRNLLLTDDVTSGAIVHSASSYIETPEHSDDFETGDMTGWNTSVTNSGDLSVASGAALNGGYGLSCLINDTTDQYVEQVFGSTTTFRCRFNFDPNSVSMTNGDEFDIVSTYDSSWAGNFFLKVGQSGGTQYLAVGERTDGAWSTYLGTYALTDAPQLIEVLWTAATGAGNNDGTLYLWVDGTLKGSTTSIDNDTGTMYYVQIGAKSKDAGTSGTIYFDDWAANTTGELLGEPFTTAQLTAPSGKTTGDFTGGKITDSENPVDVIDLGTDEYTEIEWSVEADSTYVSASDIYQFRVTDAGTVIGSYTVTPQLTIGNTVSATVSPLAFALTIPSVTATYDQIETASVSPLGMSLSIPSVTATYDSVLSATVSPLAFALSIPSITATKLQVETASVSPLSMSLTIPGVTATYNSVLSATVSPLALAMSIPAVTATYDAVISATVTPLPLALTIPTITADYIYPATATVSPLALALSIPSVTAAITQIETASVSPLTLALSIPNVTATYDSVLSATVSPLQLALTIPGVTATYNAIISATVDPLVFNLTIPSLTAVTVQLETASVAPLGFALTIPSITPTFDTLDLINPLAFALTIPEVTATATYNVAPYELIYVDGALALRIDDDIYMKV